MAIFAKLFTPRTFFVLSGQGREQIELKVGDQAYLRMPRKSCSCPECMRYVREPSTIEKIWRNRRKVKVKTPTGESILVSPLELSDTPRSAEEIYRMVG